MLRSVLMIAVLFAPMRIASAQVTALSGDSVISKCPALAGLIRSGRINHLRDPVFRAPQEARKFALECKRVVEELDSVQLLPPDYAPVRRQAALAAEFLTGDTYDLATCRVRSVVKLRDWVKIPAPPGLIYVKKYASPSAMPPEVAEPFRRVPSTERARVRGVTLQGRYIALLKSNYHEELADNLAHEMVHAYLALAAGADLPQWFQEGAAVYFSTGKESRLYGGGKDDPGIVAMTIPESYKRKLHSFQYLESKVGSRKLFEFVRQSVATGKVDARQVLGVAPSKPQPKPAAWPAFLIGGGVLVILIIAGVISYRRENWAD